MRKKNNAREELQNILKEKVLNYLSKAPRTCFELKRKYDEYTQKLQLDAQQSQIIWDAIYEMLERTGLVNEKEIAQSNVQSSKIQSKKQLIQKMTKKGLSKNIIFSSLKNFSAEKELEGARLLARKKFLNLSKDKNLTDREIKGKIFRFLVSRGYDYEICSGVVDTLNELK